jgi:hypothetical protein
MVLTNGGELWVDDGRPTLADTPKTVRNLRDVKPTHRARNNARISYAGREQQP